MIAPVSVEPVKEITGTTGCSTSALPTVSPRPCTSWITSGGKPGLEQDLDQQVTVWGTSSDGLMITAFPQSSAGNIFQVGIASGKLNGVISPAIADGPAVAHRPLVRAAREGTVWPNSRRPSVAA